MTSSGFHTNKIWKCIIFQLVYIFAVLYEHNIYMEDITLDDNFYVKDITINPSTIGSWIYKIKHLEFYVPNFGYILMFDSKYNDPKKPNKEYKILSTIYNDPTQIGPNLDKETKLKNKNVNIARIKEKIKNKFRQIIDPNNFCHYAKISNVNLIDDEIILLLTNIKQFIDTTGNEIIDIFIKSPFFYYYLHNRIGTKLTKIENDNINNVLSRNLIKPGDMCIIKTTNESRWALCLEILNPNPYRTFFKLIYKNNQDKIVVEDINSGRVIPHLDKLPLENSFEMRYDTNYIYETYYFENSVNYL